MDKLNLCRKIFNNDIDDHFIELIQDDNYMATLLSLPDIIKSLRTVLFESYYDVYCKMLSPMLDVIENNKKYYPAYSPTTFFDAINTNLKLFDIDILTMCDQVVLDHYKTNNVLSTQIIDYRYDRIDDIYVIVFNVFDSITNSYNLRVNGKVCLSYKNGVFYTKRGNNYIREDDFVLNSFGNLNKLEFSTLNFYVRSNLQVNPYVLDPDIYDKVDKIYQTGNYKLAHTLILNSSPNMFRCSI